MPNTVSTPFECAQCGAKYKLVRAEADEQTIDCQITCRKCGAPLQGRQGNAVLKYFLVELSLEPEREWSAFSNSVIRPSRTASRIVGVLSFPKTCEP